MSRALLQQALDYLTKSPRSEFNKLCNDIEAELAKPETVIFDLKHCSYDQLADAASRSNWIPEEYYANDWINDCARYLEFGFPEAPQPKPLTPSEFWDAAPWQHITSAPNDGRNVFLKDQHGYFSIAYWSVGFWSTSTGRTFHHPIAWLPLPENKK